MPKIAPVERIQLDPTSPWWGEHRSRYHFAASYVREQRVLDVACGTGFGCDILAEAGASYVVGVDVRMAKTPRHEDVGLCLGDATHVPVRTGSFTMATSFETIEHINDDERFVSELARALKPGGTLFLSTPNALHSPHNKRKLLNLLPVHEYQPEQLRRLLSKHFGEVDLRGQRTKSYYPISPYWETDEVMGRGFKTRLKVLPWKIQNRLPFRVKDGLSRLMFNRAFYPGEFDFDFSPSYLTTGHVLLAVCRL